MVRTALLGHVSATLAYLEIHHEEIGEERWSWWPLGKRILNTGVDMESILLGRRSREALWFLEAEVVELILGVNPKSGNHPPFTPQFLRHAAA